MEFLAVLERIIGLLFVASLVAIVTRHFRWPYTVGLVIVGLGFALSLDTLLPDEEQVNYLRSLIAPQIILGLLLPPLLFEAAFHINFDDLKRNLPLILIFAIPGVVISMFMIGGLIAQVTPLPIKAALLFGALISATDPISVVALFRSIGVPKKFIILLEGESLFNDGTAIVAYSLMLGIISGGKSITGVTLVTEFLWIAGGGLVVGTLVSWLSSLILRYVDDHLIEITITTITAYGSYLIAEHYHVSGVLAVVAAGLVTGNVSLKYVTPTTTISLFSFWEYAAYLANSATFLLIGLVIDLQDIASNISSILFAIVIVLAARAVVIYGFSIFQNFVEIKRRNISILYWGGLRGAISLALALSLPATLGKDQILMQNMAFGVVLFTLLVQGTTMQPLVKRLGLTQSSPVKRAYQKSRARAVAARAAYNRLNSMHEEGLLSGHAWETMEASMRRQIETHAAAVREIMHLDSKVEMAVLNDAYMEGLRAQRSQYNNLLSDGVITEEIYAELAEEVDTALINQDFSHGSLLPIRSKDQPPITKIIIAVINENDLQDTMTMLNILAIPTTLLKNSTDSFGNEYITMVLGIEDDQEDEVVDAIQVSGVSHEEDRQRGKPEILNFIPGSSEAHLSQNGTAIYVLDIDHYEEF